jgi:hypothetical protein
MPAVPQTPGRWTRTSAAKDGGMASSTKGEHNNNPMKTNTSLGIFKFSALAPLGIAIMAALAQPVVAASIQIDEFSSTNLMVAFNGLTSGVTVQNTSSDHWTVTFDPAFDFTFSSTPVAWAEPENSALDPNGLWNQVTVINNASGNQMFIVSDTSLLAGSLVASNNTFVPVGQTNDISMKERTVIATFTDHSDGVPDNGSTFGLLVLSLIGVVGAIRLRSLQSA